MADPLEQVLKLVAEGRLTAEEAAPILDALENRPTDRRSDDNAPGAAPRFARIEVVEDGRKTVDLRVPLSLGQLAMGSIPGLSGEHLGRIKEAITHGLRGPIVEINDGSDSVRIVVE